MAGDVVSIFRSPGMRAPNPDGEPLDQVLGAILYDDGSLGHWERARPTLEWLEREGKLGKWAAALVALMRGIADTGSAPTFVRVFEAIGPERLDPIARWWLYYLLDGAAFARDFDRALVDVVRRNRSEAAE